MIIVKEIDKTEAKLWDEFVLSHSESSYTHLYAWKYIYENSYGLKSIYLGIFDGSILSAVLPLVLIEFPLMKRKAFSLPYQNYCGLLALPGYDETSILNKVMEYLGTDKISLLEIRKLGRTEQSDYFTLKLNLPADSDELWKGFKPKVRNQVRKAWKFGFEIKLGKEGLDDFYNIYSRNMRDLGTPVHSKKFFTEILTTFPSETDVLTVYDGNKAAASMFLVKYKNSLSDPWASSVRDYLEFCPNMLMYWEALKYGCENGFTEFDFGRSLKDSGTYNFKSQWGTFPISLDYMSFNSNGESKKTSVALYQNKKARCFTNMWKKLPLFAANTFGPFLRKYLP